jgi:hypothetical protein
MIGWLIHEIRTCIKNGYQWRGEKRWYCGTNRNQLYKFISLNSRSKWHNV